MKKAVLCFLLSIALPLLVSAQNFSVSVIPLKSSSGVSDAELNVVTEYLEAGLINTGSFQVIAYQKDDIQTFSLNGVSEKTEIGNLLDVQYVVSGSVNNQGSSYILSVKKINVETSKAEAAAIAIMSSLSPQQMEEATQKVAYELAGLFYQPEEDQPISYKGNDEDSQQTVGILDITPKQGVSAVEADIVTDFVYDAMYRFGAGSYRIISRQNREAILAEHEFSMSGLCDDASCALEVGRYLSADLVVLGSFTKFGSKYYLSLQLVDVNTTEVSGSAREGANDLDGIAGIAVDACVAGVFGSVRPSGRTVAAPPVELKFGDRHAGGVVFYLDGNGGGLVCAEEDQSGDIKWGVEGTKIGNTSSTLGTGAANTEAIVSKLGSGTYAAKLCYDLILNGYDDWFLPSKDELNLMYENLHKRGLGGFGTGSSYWSSSEYDSTYSWGQSFYTGNQNYKYRFDYGKNYHNYVRAVRAF